MSAMIFHATKALATYLNGDRPRNRASTRVDDTNIEITRGIGLEIGGTRIAIYTAEVLGVGTGDWIRETVKPSPTGRYIS